MADDDLARAALRHLDDAAALREVWRNRLFHQDVVALLERGDRVADVLAVHRRDDEDVRELFLREQFLGAREAALRRDIVELPRLFDALGPDVRHGDDLHAVRKQRLHRGVRAAAVAEAGDRKGDRCFHSVLLLILSVF